MSGQFVRGTLVGVVDGPAMILEIRGEEKKYPLEVSLPLSWVQKNMDQQVTVVIKGGRVIEVK
jgi:hypothetical protein